MVMKCTIKALVVYVALVTRCCCSFFILPSSITSTCPSLSNNSISIISICGKNGAIQRPLTKMLRSRRISTAAAATAVTTVAEIDTETISVALPSNWRDDKGRSNNEEGYCWSIEAADKLIKYGVVALTASSSSSSSNNSDSNNSATSLISTETIKEANISAQSRLQDMQSRITSRGVDCTGINDGPYRFAEIICRDDGGLRYDVPLPWLGDVEESSRSVEKTQQQQPRQQVVGSDRIGAPLSNMEKNGVVDLHMAIDQIVPPVLEALWSRDDDDSNNIGDDKDGSSSSSSSNTRSSSSSSYVAAAGFLINEPGSKSQNWHKDGPDPGFINCFVPLIDLTEELGPTAFSLAIDDGGIDDYMDNNDDEDDDRKNVLVPMLNKGNILLFDYRTLHRGQGNTSNDDITRTLAYAVYCRRRARRTSPVDDDGVVKESGDVHNFPAALTLEYD